VCLQRILKVDYHIPSHIKLSPEGHDLLRRVLVADPTQRINVAQIYDHPWYCKNLPPGVKEMNDRPQPLPEGLQSVEEISRIVQVGGR
jgi:serine/threonine protein kinase